MEQTRRPVRLLQAAVELLEVKVRLRAEEQHPPVEVFQLHGEGQSHRGVAVQTGKLSEDLFSSGDFSCARQHQEAEGDVEVGGGQPVGGGGGQEGGELLLQQLETGEDGRRVGPERDEVCGPFLRWPPAAALVISWAGRC